jgi:hypothetical protein
LIAEKKIVMSVATVEARQISEGMPARIAAVEADQRSRESSGVVK